MKLKSLTKAFRNSSDTAVKEGMSWYVNAHLFCKETAEVFGCSIPKAAAVLAALSPGTTYEENKRATVALFNIVSGRQQHYSFATYGQNVTKAKAIATAEDKGDFVGYFSPKTGPKTYNFYLNIVNPEGNEVTIDRHAYRIATGEEYSQLGVAQYRKIAEAYRRAAKRVGVLPLQLQAVLWVDYRIRIGVDKRP